MSNSPYEKTIVRSALFDRVLAAAKGQPYPVAQPRPAKQG
jgi:hypothetical protein